MFKFTTGSLLAMFLVRRWMGSQLTNPAFSPALSTRSFGMWVSATFDISRAAHDLVAPADQLIKCRGCSTSTRVTAALAVKTGLRAFQRINTEQSESGGQPRDGEGIRRAAPCGGICEGGAVAGKVLVPFPPSLSRAAEGCG